MPNLNKVMLIGNLTRDPETRVTPKGTTICTFSIAVNRKWRDESQQDHEEVTYIDIEAWGKTGETIAKYCTKGKPLFIEGRLRLDQWEDKNTKEKRSRMKVVCDQFQFLGANDSAQGQGGGGRFASPAPRPAAAPKEQFLDEDVPY
ncbi:MAG: single-stranded DNA-binding protein [Candidatus Didemnitutus sp.]|nr:single-stranded DNA-binding protein [Candidatus Didemnitutus sp.]